MRNMNNVPIYRQAEALAPNVLAELIGDDRHEEVEHVRYAFMAWISDQRGIFEKWENAWAKFDPDRKRIWRRRPAKA